MAQYCCQDCWTTLGLVSVAHPASFTGTNYQSEMFTKHHAPTGNYQRNSVFDDPSYPKYSDYMATGSIAGYLEIDYYSRRNLIWAAGERTGAEYQRGVFFATSSGIKIVGVENHDGIHSYPVREIPGSYHFCRSCGKSLPKYV